MACDESIQSRIVRSSGSKPGMVRRRFPRFPVELPCLYSLDNGPDWNGTAIDLSRGGCAIRSTTPVQKGNYLKVLIFPSTDQAPIEVANLDVGIGLRGDYEAHAVMFGCRITFIRRRDTRDCPCSLRTRPSRHLALPDRLGARALCACFFRQLDTMDFGEGMVGS